MKVITFGCRLNIFESALIREMGSGMDDVVLFNTCAVTGEAERQCRQAIRKMKKENPHLKIIVSGCAAQLNPEIYAQMPEVAKVLGNREKLDPVALASDEKIQVGEIKDTLGVPGLVTNYEGHTKAFLQIQQGCNHRCTFCVVPLVRGKNVGMDPDRIIQQARIFTEQGFPEIILTGVDVTSYPQGFSALIKRLIDTVPEIKRLRFGSLDPAALDRDFIRLMADEERLMPHLHLSIQAGDDLILKRMGRRHTHADVIKVVNDIRAVRPDTTFGSDFITGFPTETDAQFNRTMDLVNAATITHLHVFPYSIRSGTPAAKMPMVDVPVRKERAKKLRDLGLQKHRALCESMLGKRVSVLIEKEGIGFCENYVKVEVAHFNSPVQKISFDNQMKEGADAQDRKRALNVRADPSTAPIAQLAVKKEFLDRHDGQIMTVTITEVTSDGLVGRP